MFPIENKKARIIKKERYWMKIKGLLINLPILAFVMLCVGSFMTGFSNHAYADYKQVRVWNFMPVPVRVNILYSGCRHDTLDIPAARYSGGKVEPTSAAKSAGHYEKHHKHIWRWWKRDDPRGFCLVTKIDVSPRGSFQGKSFSVDAYKSSGTSYWAFGIYQRSATRYRVMSNAEIKSEKETAGMSPGFRIHNRSSVPLTISLDQVGCLYYQNNVKPGETFERDTGAVWFTIRAKLYDEKQRTNNWACAKPVVEYVGFALVSAISGGGLSASAFAWSAASQGTTKVALAVVEEHSKMMSKAVERALGGTGPNGQWVAKKVEEMLAVNTSVTSAGQYAGPPWPFRCTKKPEYEITGGPDWGLLKGLKTQAEYDAKMRDILMAKSPLKIRKINTCG
jgi:hypothetical protein